MLGQLALHLVRLRGGVHQRLDGELVARAGTAARHGVRAHQGITGASRGGRLRGASLRLHGLDARGGRLVVRRRPGTLGALGRVRLLTPLAGCGGEVVAVRVLGTVVLTLARAVRPIAR